MTDRAAPRECSHCGEPLRPDDRFCSQCGDATNLRDDPDVTLVNPGRGARRSTEPSVAPDADDTLVNPVASPPPPPPPPRTSSAFQDRLHHVLGKEYEVIALTGQGGFARVYRAHDTRLNRLVAIKVLKPDLLDSPDMVERFRSEGVALAQLRHPGIVPIFDIRERDGLLYYVMPFVHGVTLESRLEHRVPPLEARRILSELADALAAAHRANMIHLDIKPANVFLEGDLGKILLMDFGIAESTDDHRAGKRAIAGTPEYMSPEQAQGRAGIDHRSDIYSLGALGYRMLVGRTPFRGKRVTQTLAKQVTETATPIREINPSVPKDFADAIMRCLAKDPAERFSTALELRAALDAVTFFSGAGEPVPEKTGAVSRVLLVALGLVVGVWLGFILA